MSAGCGMCANGTVLISWHLSHHKPSASLVCSAVHQAAHWLPAEDGSVLERLGVARAVKVLTLCNKVESLVAEHSLLAQEMEQHCKYLQARHEAAHAAIARLQSVPAQHPLSQEGRFLAGQCYAGAAESVHLPTARRCL